MKKLSDVIFHAHSIIVKMAEMLMRLLRSVSDRSLAVVEFTYARDSFHTASAPLLEKQALAFAAVTLNQLDDTIERNRRSAEFREINEKYTAVVSWTAL